MEQNKQRVNRDVEERSQSSKSARKSKYSRSCVLSADFVKSAFAYYPVLNRALAISLTKYVALSYDDAPSLHFSKLKEEVLELEAAFAMLSRENWLHKGPFINGSIANYLAEVSDVLHEVAYFAHYGKGYVPAQGANTAVSYLLHYADSLRTDVPALVPCGSSLAYDVKRVCEEALIVCKDSSGEGQIKGMSLVEKAARTAARLAARALTYLDVKDDEYDYFNAGKSAFRLLCLVNMIKHCNRHKDKPSLIFSEKEFRKYVPCEIRTWFHVFNRVFDAAGIVYDPTVAEFITLSTVERGSCVMVTQKIDGIRVAAVVSPGMTHGGAFMQHDDIPLEYQLHMALVAPFFEMASCLFTYRHRKSHVRLRFICAPTIE